MGNPYLFNGLRYDQETGFYGRGILKSTDGGKEWSTCFDPLTGRSLTRSQPDSSGNAYSFAGNNPWSSKAKNWLVSNFEFGVPGPAASPESPNLTTETQTSAIGLLLPAVQKDPWLRADAPRRSGQATGKRQHMPMRFRAYIDQAVPSGGDSLTHEAGHWMGAGFQIISAGRDAYEHRDLYRNIWVTGGETPAAASHQGWGKWEINAGKGSHAVQYNPKEIGLDKSVPWQKSRGSGPSSIGCQTMSPGAVRHRFFSIVDRTSLGGGMVLPRMGWEIGIPAGQSAGQATGKRQHLPIRFRAYY